MKKSLFLLLVLGAFIISNVNAQDVKVTKGWTTEFNLVPFAANPLTINYLKTRMFLSDKMAIRLGIDLAVVSKKDDLNNGKNNPVGEEKNSYFVFGLHPGIEMHMEGTEKLSPYYGAEIAFVTKSSKGEETSIDVNGDGKFEDKIECKKIWTDGTNRAYSSIGLNLFIGTDYYINNHLFLGAELGFGFTNTSNAETETTSTIDGTKGDPIKALKSSEMDLGFNFNPAFRLGWAF